jgi:hypothetical protein
MSQSTRHSEVELLNLRADTLKWRHMERKRKFNKFLIRLILFLEILKNCEYISGIMSLITCKQLSLSILYAGTDHVLSNLVVSFHWEYKKNNYFAVTKTAPVKYIITGLPYWNI